MTGKELSLLLLIILAIGSTGGYLFLTEKINAGSQKIAAGQKQLAEGEQMVAQGKVKLANGSQQLSEVKSGYGGVKKTSYAWVAALPVAGQVIAVVGNKVINDKINEGNQLVANGNKKIQAGEAQLKAGKLELRNGETKLKRANQVRIACAVGAVVFASLFIVLMVFWRRKNF